MIGQTLLELGHRILLGKTGNIAGVYPLDEGAVWFVTGKENLMCNNFLQAGEFVRVAYQIHIGNMAAIGFNHMYRFDVTVLQAY
jgi:hypothetical protein